MQELYDCLERNNNLGLKLSNLQDCSSKESVSNLKQIFCPVVFFFFFPLLQCSPFSTVVKMLRWVEGYFNITIIHSCSFYLIVYTTLWKGRRKGDGNDRSRTHTLENELQQKSIFLPWHGFSCCLFMWRMERRNFPVATMCRVDGHGESGEGRGLLIKTMMCVFSISDLFWFVPFVEQNSGTVLESRSW